MFIHTAKSKLRFIVIKKNEFSLLYGFRSLSTNNIDNDHETILGKQWRKTAMDEV
jgi:hypothetical protein